MKIICPNRSKDTQSLKIIFHIKTLQQKTFHWLWQWNWNVSMIKNMNFLHGAQYIQCIEPSENFAFLHPAGYIIRFIIKCYLVS